MNRGKNYEEIAEKFLRAKEFKIVEKNYRSKWGEIDLIALKNRNLFIIEVKGGKNLNLLPERINCSKISKILKTLKVFLTRNPNLWDFDISFIALFVDDKGNIKEVKFSIDDCFDTLSGLF
jgi:putative endonuclease